jgi:hypothetical protein
MATAHQTKRRTVIERRISTYPAGALEFNLQALRDDPIPTLEAQLSSLTSAGISGSDSAELVVRLTTEKEKQERWAVREIIPVLTLPLFPKFLSALALLLRRLMVHRC